MFHKPYSAYVNIGKSFHKQCLLDPPYQNVLQQRFRLGSKHFWLKTYKASAIGKQAQSCKLTIIMTIAEMYT
jgi:hypothetical protein